MSTESESVDNIFEGIEEGEIDFVLNALEESKNDSIDYKKRFDRAMEGAAKGYTSAMNELGLLYFYGKGLEKDYSKALEWFKKAADKDSAFALYKMGGMYFYGIGVVEDKEKGFNYLLESADKNNIEAKKETGLILCSGKYQNRIDYKAAMKYFREAAAYNNKRAMKLVADMYYNGYGVEKDSHEAFIWNKKAADLGDAEATFYIFQMYLKGEGVDQDLKKAIEYCEEAAEKGVTEAMNIIGIFYYQGTGVEVDKQKAKEWITKAIDNGNNDAKVYLDKINKEETNQTKIDPPLHASIAS